MQEIVYIYSSNIKEIHCTNQDLQNYIDIVKKERAAYTAHKTLHFKDISKITVNSDSVTPQKKKMGERKIVRIIVRLLIKKRGK